MTHDPNSIVGAAQANARHSQCEPTDGDIIRAFIRELEDNDAMVHTNRTNALGCYDTQSWGAGARRVLASALRSALASAEK